MLRAVRFAATFDFDDRAGHARRHPRNGRRSHHRQRRADRHGNPPHAPRRPTAPRRSQLLRETNLLPHVLPGSRRAAACRLAASDASDSRVSANRRFHSLLRRSLSTIRLTPRSLLPAPCPHRRPPPAIHQQRNRPHRLAAEPLPAVVASRSSYLGPDCNACSSTTAPPNSSRCTKRSPAPPIPALAFCRERLAWPAERLNPPPLVDGADLIRHGLQPGPNFAASSNKSATPSSTAKSSPAPKPWPWSTDIAAVRSTRYHRATHPRP